MKILVYSDLHLESSPFVPPSMPVDVVVLAGDIDNGLKGAQWALEHFKNVSIIYVPGNHEYYQHHFPHNTKNLQKFAHGTNLHVLDLNTIKLKNVEFFGCTLWTALDLNNDIASAQDCVSKKMNDYRFIKYQDGLIQPEIMRQYHHASIRWLQQALNDSTAKHKIVITHHAPSKRSVSEDFLARDIAVGYVTELEDFIHKNSIDLWIHGHTHQKIDYHIGQTRVVSNPRGYRASKQQLRFNPEEIIIVNN